MWTALQALMLFIAIALVLQPGTSLAAPEKACHFTDDAPELHRVVRGDTLWDIAARFLHDPWCWPRVWDGNRDAITNPHLIYPGQQIRFDRTRGQLTVASGDDPSDALPVVRLAPAKRAEMMAMAPVPLLASTWLALVQRTPLMSAAEVAQAPRIVALSAERRMAGAGDLVYARSNVRDDTGSALQRLRSAELRRPLAPVIDPDNGQQIALATRRVGSADWLRGTPDGVQTMQVTEATEEVMTGDVLVDLLPPQAARPGIAPHAASAMHGRIAAVLHDGRWATLHDIVALNRGARHGLDAGSVVNVVRPVRIRAHESPQASPAASGIDEPVATLLVVDVLDHAALAIVMRAQEPFTTGATVVSPDIASK